MGKSVVKGLLCLLTMLCVISCTNTQDYAEVIPGDAAIVMSFDIKKLGSKASLSENKELSDKFFTLLKAQMDDASYSSLEALVKEPKKAGISFTDDIYMYVSPKSNSVEVGIVAKVTDVANLKKTFDGFSDIKLDKDGNTYLMSLEGQVIGAFNDNVLLLYGAEDSNKASIESLLKQSGGKSFASRKEFKEMNSMSGDIVFYMSYEFFNSMEYAALQPALMMYKNMGLDLSECKVLAGIAFEKGIISLDTKMLNMPEGMKKLQKDVARKVDGKFMKCFPESTLIWGVFNINGGKYLENMLAVMPELKEQLNAIPGVDVKKLFGSIDGEVAFGMTSFSDSEMPGLSLYAQVKDYSLIDLLDENLGGFKRFYGIDWGKLDKTIYVSSDKKLLNNPGEKLDKSVTGASWASNVKGSYGFMVLDVQEICSALREAGATRDPQIGMGVEIFEGCDYIDVYATSYTEGKVNVVLKDKKTNALKQIIDGLDALSKL